MEFGKFQKAYNLKRKFTLYLVVRRFLYNFAENKSIYKK